jgi:chromosome partitioning protein
MPKPNVIAVYSEKGGAGKTTLAVHLALKMKAASVIDADPQGSAMRWLRQRKDDGPKVISATSLADLPDDLDTPCVMDMRPQLSAGVRQLLDLAECIVVPVRTSVVDLQALPATVDIVRSTGKRAGFVVNVLDQRTLEAKEIVEALAEYQLPIIGVLTRRVAYGRAALTGQTAGELGDKTAEDEISRLVERIEKWES